MLTEKYLRGFSELTLKWVDTYSIPTTAIILGLIKLEDDAGRADEAYLRAAELTKDEPTERVLLERLKAWQKELGVKDEDLELDD